MTTLLNQFLPLPELFSLVRRQTERDVAYTVYWKDEESEPDLSSKVLVASPVEVRENGEEIFPRIVTEIGYWPFCSDELLQDVVDVAMDQDPRVSDEMLRGALLHYLERDCFLDLDVSDFPAEGRPSRYPELWLADAGPNIEKVLIIVFRAMSLTPAAVKEFLLSGELKIAGGPLPELKSLQQALVSAGAAVEIRYPWELT